MEEVTSPWICKISDGHWRLVATYRTCIDGDESCMKAVHIVNPTEEALRSTAIIVLSPELRTFVDNCMGSVEVLGANFELSFSDKEDFVRYMMSDFSERYFL